jgi:hypothetical protein
LNKIERVDLGFGKAAEVHVPRPHLAGIVSVGFRLSSAKIEQIKVSRKSTSQTYCTAMS